MLSEFSQSPVAQKWTRGKVLFIALAARVTLVLYANIHDYVFNVSFTDVDYSVFCDAAAHVAEGRSPFERHTYRYTPALAWLLLPVNHYRDFGKLLFCAMDIVVGWLCMEMCSDGEEKEQREREKVDWSRRDERKSRRRAEKEKEDGDETVEKEAVEDNTLPLSVKLVVLLWLANPLTAVVSARGNADVLVCAAVLTVLWMIRQGKWLSAAVVHGFVAVHLKIYPLIYLPSIYIHFVQTDSGRHVMSLLNGRLRVPMSGWERTKALFFNQKGWTFAVVSLVSLAVPVYVFYCLYGEQFLDEFLFYHVRRRDNRHNFSPYWYALYLSDREEWGRVLGYGAFLPQMTCVIYAALRFSSDLPFCWFITTMSFVSLNKVCTSQYFVWYIVFLPMVARSVHMTRSSAIRLVCLWFAGQAAWLLPAYLFEFHAWRSMQWMGAAGVLFLFINCHIMRCVIGSYVGPGGSKTGGGEVKSKEE